MKSDPLRLPLPPSELDAALKAVCIAIEDEEVPLLEDLERQDQSVWIRFSSGKDGKAKSMAVLESPPSDQESEGYFRHSRLDLWNKMNHASQCVDAALHDLTVPDHLRMDPEWHERWTPLLASGGHGFRLFELDFARNFLPQFGDMYRRALELSSLALYNPPSPLAAPYLQRLPRAYVFGLDSEVLILCRSAIEAALKDRAADGPRESLFELLKRAETEDWLPKDEITSADLLRKAVNAVVHEDPVSDAEALDAIRVTVTIVSRLLPEEQDERPNEDE